jgi:hypothetical protein
MVDSPGKARHCTLMLLAAGTLADCAPDDVQQRALARYTFLFADALLLWARRWRNELKRDPSRAAGARAAREPIDELEAVLDSAGAVRDYLAAKRQSVGELRPDDMEATWLLWAAVNPRTVRALGNAAVRAYDTLNEAATAEESIVQALRLSKAERGRVRSSLPARDPAHWHLAADTAADLRPHTLPAAQGGDLGRLIAQVNDVGGHLDVLLRIAPVVTDAEPYDLLVRSGIIVELNALLDLTVGPPPGHKRNVERCLIDLCRQGRAQGAADELERLRDSIGIEGRAHIRWARNKLGAHVDDDLTCVEIRAHLLGLDYQGVVRVAEHVLDWLDALGATQLDLPLLLIGERPIRTWTTNTDAPSGAVTPEVVPGGLAELFRTIDSPFMAATASPLGSAILAAITQRREPEPRAKITVPQPPS